MTEAPSNPLLPHLARALEAVIANVLKLDPQAGARLAELNGQAVELTWAGPNWGLRLEVDDGRIAVKPRNPEREPDLAVRGPLSGALAAFLSLRNNAALPTGALKISGDIGLAKRLSEFAERFQPDFEAGLSQRLGPVWGPQLARGLAGAFAYARDSSRSLVEDAATHLRDESGDIVARNELDSFLDEVDQLRNRVEHTAARIAALAKSTESVS